MNRRFKGLLLSHHRYLSVRVFPQYLRKYSCLPRFFLASFFLLKLSFYLLAQSYPDPAIWAVERIPVLEQIGSRGVHCVAEDQQGYLWVGSNNGIARYDGYTFKNYLSVPDDTTTLNHKRTSFAYITYDNTLWVGTAAGINRYIPECDCFKQYNATGAPDNSIPDGEVNWIAEDQENKLWVVTQNGGLYRYRKEMDNFERFLFRSEDPIDISSFQARALLCDQEGFIWVGTGETFIPEIKGDGLIRFNPNTGEAKQYLHDPDDPFSLIDNRVSALLQDSKGRIWIGSCQSGLHVYDAEYDHFIRMNPGEDAIYAPQIDIAPWSACPHIRVIHEDRWGGIWVATFQWWNSSF